MSMPKLTILTFLTVIFILFIIIHPSIALADPLTPTPTPRKPTCDLCGWCNRFATPPAPSPGNWNKCSSCLYDANGNEKPSKYYTLAGCLDAESGPLVQRILTIVMGVSGGLAFLSVLYGSGLILTSSGDPQKIKNGKDTITSSLLGILLIVFSIFILKIVGYDILKIPWLG